MIDRRGCIRAATHAANDSEWGYDAEMARDYLNSIDPDYDWESELLQYELEEGHRTMGPYPPPSEESKLLMEMYLPVILDQLKTNPLLKLFDKD